MRRTVLTTALLLAGLAGPPAEAACVGCGGVTGTPGSAAIGASGTGLHSSHVATADCAYTSVPNPTTGARGLLSLTVRASSAAASIFVSGACWIESPGSFSVTATAHGPSPSVSSGRDEPVPPDMFVTRICVRVTANWYSGLAGDGADATECTRGASATVGGVHADVPINP